MTAYFACVARLFHGSVLMLLIAGSLLPIGGSASAATGTQWDMPPGVVPTPATVLTQVPPAYRAFLVENGGPKFVRIRDSYLHYVETGDPGTPLLLLVHGSPFSSFEFRNVLPQLAAHYHVIAVDQIGFGLSGKPAIVYNWETQIAYLSEFIDTLQLRHVTIIATDIGGMVSFSYAMDHRDNVAGIAFYETFTAPIPSANALAYCGQCASFFPRPRDPQMTDQYIINNPQFIAQSVGQSFLKPVSDDVTAAYAYPFPTPESKRAATDMGDSMPIAGQPANTFRLAMAFNQYLSTTTTPKLALYGTPGFVMPKTVLDAYQWPNLTVQSVGPGVHYLAEDAPDALAHAILDWRGSFD